MPTESGLVGLCSLSMCKVCISYIGNVLWKTNQDFHPTSFNLDTSFTNREDPELRPVPMKVKHGESSNVYLCCFSVEVRDRSRGS